TQAYDVSVDDGFGGVATQAVTVTLMGVNDAPVIESADAQASLLEDAAPSGVEAASGEIAFSDVDLTDGHTVAMLALGSGYLGTFAATLGNDSTGGAVGAAGWTFSVDDAAIQALA